MWPHLSIALVDNERRNSTDIGWERYEGGAICRWLVNIAVRDVSLHYESHHERSVEKGEPKDADSTYIQPKPSWCHPPMQGISPTVSKWTSRSREGLTNDLVYVMCQPTICTDNLFIREVPDLGPSCSSFFELLYLWFVNLLFGNIYKINARHRNPLSMLSLLGG